MKTRRIKLAAFCTLLLTQVGCELGIQESNIPDGPIPTTYNYTVKVSAVSQSSAPALQSFAHGVNGDDVLLFGGRTNNTLDGGGLHNMDNASNYASSSFRPLSYNTNLFVYNIKSNSVDTLSSDSLEAKLVAQFCTGNSAECLTFFKNAMNNLCKVTNPISTQNGDTLYVLGGYGFGPNTAVDSNNYLTYNQITSIDIPTMIKLVKGNAMTISDWQKLIRIGTDPTNALISTGAEMFKIGGSIYLAGGHRYDTAGQKYLDAVYPFMISNDANSPYKLSVSVGNFISDVSDPTGTTSDKLSKFRRRDGPVTAALFKNSKGDLVEGLTFYSGVFTPSTTAWKTAIYVHPSIGTASNYTIDTAYSQTQSVYACSDFSAYDAASSAVHTFLLGGIGNDITKPMSSYPDSLSAMPLAFTNNGAHITFDLDSMTSTNEVMVDVFPPVVGKLYGAESTLIPTTSSDVHYVTANGDETEVIDLENSVFTNNELNVGHVYGGIEAFQLNPGVHGTGNGPGLSAASNKIWKVTLIRTATN